MPGRRLVGALLLAAALVLPSAAGTVVAAEPPAPTHEPEDVRQLADDVLARGEFQPPERTLLERFFDWLLPGDSGSGDSGSGGSGDAQAGAAGTGGSSALTSILLVVAVVAVGFIVHVLIRQPRRARSDDDDDPAPEVEPHRTARQWSSAAEEAEAAGRWKDGLRARFRALVEELTEGRVVPEVAGRTTGELRADVAAGLPAAAASFAVAAELFDRAWYGDLPTGPEESRRFAAAAAAVLAEVPRRPTAPPEPVEVEA